MRMGHNPAGAVFAVGSRPSPYTPLGQFMGARPVPGIGPREGEVWINGQPLGAPRPILGDCKALEDAELAALKAWNSETNPFAKEVLRAIFWDAASRRYRAGCGPRQELISLVPQFYDSVGRPVLLTDNFSKPQTNNPYQYVAPNAAVNVGNAGVTLGPVGFVKAAGQVVVGESPNAMSALVGLAMIGGAGYLGYYLGRRAKRKNRK